MTEDEARRRVGSYQIQRLAELRVEDPEIEGEAKSGKPLQPGTEISALEQVRCRMSIADNWIGIPSGGMAHATEAPSTGTDVRLEDRLDAVTEREIGEADNARGDARRTIGAAIAHGGDAGDELRLAYRTHLLRTGGAVHGMALDEDSSSDLVPGVQVGEELRQQVTLVWPVP